ncbi:MAG: hypothetical protein ABI688_01220 [Bacteroidota bacterium]
MKKIISILIVCVVVAGLIILAPGCNKNDPYTLITPPEQAHFVNKTVATYYVKNDPNSVYKIPIGLTTTSSSARTVVISVSSSTGAIAGTQYTIPSTTVTIPANSVVDSLAVKGLFAGYPGNRIDTLTFTITGGSAAVSEYNSVFKLVLRKYCDVVSSSLIGSYTNTRDYDGTLAGTPSASRYTATLSNWTSTGLTSATVIIKNLAATSDIGFGPFAANEPIALNGVSAILDWTNPANFSISIPSQPYMLTTFGYGPSTISGSGTFSSCDQTFTVTTTVRVSAGAFSAVVSQLVR